MNQTTPPEPCAHNHRVVESRGSMRFVNGAVDDDLTEALVCTDCCEELNTATRTATMPADVARAVADAVKIIAEAPCKSEANRAAKLATGIAPAEVWRLYTKTGHARGCSLCHKPIEVGAPFLLDLLMETRMGLIGWVHLDPKCARTVRPEWFVETQKEAAEHVLRVDHPGTELVEAV